jgi:methanogenic corrinoid protein MtbC1
MSDLAKALSDLEEQQVNLLVEERIGSGASAMAIVGECNAGMVAVGERFARGEYFISQLIYAAEILKGVMRRIDPLLAGQGAGAARGKVVLGTVKGDIHDIGKNIVATLLRGAGFEVLDLGVDVPAERFVAALQESGARVLGLSALLNFTYPEMKHVVAAVDAAGLRPAVRIVLGGAPVNEQVRQYAGADFAAENAVAGVEICRRVYG